LEIRILFSSCKRLTGKGLGRLATGLRNTWQKFSMFICLYESILAPMMRPECTVGILQFS